LVVKSINSAAFNGELRIPASKSQAQRAIALALLNKGGTTIHGLGFCDDEKVALGIVKSVGADVRIEHDTATIHSEGFAPTSPLQVEVGESGLSSRMFTPILANSKHPVEISGKGSLLSRPMDFFYMVLPELGVRISGKNKALPFTIEGPLQAKSISVSGEASSQYITGLVYGFLGSPNAAGKVITIHNLKSRPYFELSIAVLEHFGCKLAFNNDNLVFPANYQLQGNHTITIEGDWSSASFFIVAAAINGELTLQNLYTASKQADKAILAAVADFGAGVTEHTDNIVVTTKEKKAFRFDATDCPDLFPPLAVLAAFAEGESEIKGLHRLKHKESDRGEGIKSSFAALGIKVELDYENDIMRIAGQQAMQSGEVSSLNDHRMAMALTLIGVLSGKEVTVTQAEAVNKSFPSFYEQLKEITVRAITIT
jgi:3-phosphoshikimate 1-carboxyvinyltransferase